MTLFKALSAAAIGCTLFCPLPALAQSNAGVIVPQGCEAFLSVQSRSCVVSHYWRCEAEPEGTHWRLSMDQDGAFYLSYTDHEYRWLLSYDLRGGGQSTLIQPEDDPASITELLERGSDSMVFSVIREASDGTRIQRDYTGFDMLTGETAEIDGRRLALTQFSYEYDLGNGPRRVEGGQYIWPEMRLFFGGQEIVTTADGRSFETDHSPMEFAEPGEAGFLSPTPLYDCGDTMS